MQRMGDLAVVGGDGVRRTQGGDADHVCAAAFLRRSLRVGELGAALRVQRLAPRSKAVGGAAEALAGVSGPPVGVRDPAAGLLDRGVPGRRERNDLERLLAV